MKGGDFCWPPAGTRNWPLTSMALTYASDAMNARVVIIKMLPGNEASVRLARSLGARWIRQEPSDSGATFDVYELVMNRAG